MRYSHFFIQCTSTILLSVWFAVLLSSCYQIPSCISILPTQKEVVFCYYLLLTNPQNRGVFLYYFSFRLPHHLPYSTEKQNYRSANCQHISHRLCQKYRKYLILKKAGQNVNQRNQQNNLSKCCQEQGMYCFSQCYKSLLAGNLCTKETHSRHIDGHGPFGIFDSCHIR